MAGGMTGFIGRFIACCIAALVIGIGSALWAIDRGEESRSIKNGPWRTNLEVGTSDLDAYSKSAIALHALLALNRTEAIYYVAETDNDGAKLNAACQYRISGSHMDTRWWTITAYGSDHFLMKTDQERYSVSMLDVGDDEFTFAVGLNPPDKGAWLPTNGKDNFSLFLRLYSPSEEFLEASDTVVLPSIVREECP